MVEVCRIKDILPHKNADKLEIAVIKGWESIVGKGEYKAGDTVVYIPVDAVLPLELAERLGVSNLWRNFRDSHTNLYKGEVVGRTAGAEKLAAVNVQEVYKMRQNKIKDHWVMAGKFCSHAIRLLNHVNLSQRHLAPPRIHTMDRIKGT